MFVAAGEPAAAGPRAAPPPAATAAGRAAEDLSALANRFGAINAGSSGFTAIMLAGQSQPEVSPGVSERFHSLTRCAA